MLQVKALGVGRLLVDKNGFLYKSWYQGGTPKQIKLPGKAHQYGVSTYFRGKEQMVVDLTIMEQIQSGTHKGEYVFSGALLKKWYENSDAPVMIFKDGVSGYEVKTSWFDGIPDNLPVIVRNQTGTVKSFPNKATMMEKIVVCTGCWTVYQMAGHLDVELPTKPVVTIK